MGADAVVIRHSASGAPHRLATAGWIDTPVLNAGDGEYQHPTQALLDAYTMRRHLRANSSRGATLQGVRVVIVGDVLHSRVARSNVGLLHTLGAQVLFVAPPTLRPVGVTAWPCQVGYDLDEAIKDFGPDAVMMLRIQHERMLGTGGGFFPSAMEYARRYGLDAVRLEALPRHALVMHPGPMNRGLEISAAAADSPRSTVVDQISNGVAVRMAVLYLMLAGRDEAGSTDLELEEA